MKRALLMNATAILFLSGTIAAQGRNFAGTWTVDVERTMAAGGGAVIARGSGGGGGGVGVASAGGGGGTGGAVVMRSGGSGGGGVVSAGGGGGGFGGGGGGRSGGAVAGVSAGMTLTIDASTFTIAQGQTSTSYRTDGSITNLDNAMRAASAKASWQGDKLVVETTTASQNGPVVSQATWSLEGDTLVRENKSTGPDGQEIVRKTFYKRAGQQ